MNARPSPYRPPGHLEIASALAPYRGPWNERRAAHLLRRAAFGGSPQQIARVAAASMDATVDSLVNFPNSDMLAAPPEGYDMDLRFNRGMSIEQRKAMRKRAHQTLLGMQMWWLGRMLASPAPLQEKMTLFWHGNFCAAALQKNIGPRDAYNQNAMFRRYALGNVRALTQAVSKDPAELKYLDNVSSVQAHPNENYARELMELFTLGIGNYTEQDVRESARAFTGWSVDRRSGEFFFNQRAHDYGPKTFLGQSGNLDGSDIVNIIFAQPAAARLFAKKLLSYFVYSDPEPELVDALAGVVKKNDFNMKPVLSMLLRSNVLYSDRAYRALVKSPVEFVVGTFKTFGLNSFVPNPNEAPLSMAQAGGKPPGIAAAQGILGALARMGQILFYPPNVKGWDGGSAWLNSSTVLTRENFASAIMNSQTMMQSSWISDVPMGAKDATQRLVDGILQGDASAAAQQHIQAYLSGSDVSALGMLSGENYQERIRGAAYLTMATPAYQLN